MLRSCKGVRLDAGGIDARSTCATMGIGEVNREKENQMNDDDFAKLLQYLIDHPEERPAEFEREMRAIYLDPHFHQGLVEHAKHDEPTIMNMLLSFARE